MKLPVVSRIETKEELFDTIRREILSARLKVTLDKELGRSTSETVKKLAGMKLPQISITPDETASKRLFRAILAARLRVTRDRKLSRTTPDRSKRLAEMQLPRISRP